MPSSTFSSDHAEARRQAPRLTAADRPGVAQPVPERPIPEQPWRGIAAGALVLALLLIGGWEWYWRDFGLQPSYRDDAALWANQRRRLDSTEHDATVIIGSSRVFFDVQLPVWERLSGRRPIQLAIVGTSPLFALENLAQDPRFDGRVLVGVAPDIFFSGYEYRDDWLKYLHHQSPSERVGKWLSMHFIEPYLAFYDEDLALFTVLKRQAWPVRTGRHPRISVRKLGNTQSDRNNRMWSKLETDPDYRALARRIWAQDFDDPPPTADEAADNQRTLDKQIERAVAAVAKLRARGIPVLFVREPSSGEYLTYERRVLPREATWDLLLAKSGAPGINFEDYPALQGFNLPDWSHIAASDADRFTTQLYDIVERQFGQPQGIRW